jgi:hypothetical protein
VFYQILVKIRGEAKYLYRSDKIRTVNVLNCLKNDRSSKFIVYVVIACVYVVYVEKIKVKVSAGLSKAHKGHCPRP